MDITLNGVSIAADASVFQKGKGIIVVSGTTDTYLPRSVADGFSDAWEVATGAVSYIVLYRTPARLLRGLGRIGAKRNRKSAFASRAV